MKLFLSCLPVLASLALADSATQTDWSSGSGVPGPVTDWDSSFNVSTNVSSNSLPGGLYLSSIPKSPEEHSVDGSFAGAFCVYSADLDGDGDVDVVGSANSANCINWWENTNGSGTAWTERIIDTCNDPESVCCGDIDGDGDQDILGASYTASGYISWWENVGGTGTAWAEHTIDGNVDHPRTIDLADVDGDGDLDALAAVTYGWTITWWENENGTGTVWTEHTVQTGYQGAVSVYTADVNGDGDRDIIGAAYNLSNVSWWQNEDGLGTAWTQHIIDSTYGGSNCVYSADIDDDGDMDILGAAELDGLITWWENTNGAGTSWTEHTIKTGYVYARYVYADDMDGDGDIDILGAARTSDSITWWENADGSGGSWVEHVVDSAFDGAFTVHAADVDGDGDLDVLGAANYANAISWWEVTLFQSPGQLESSILDTGVIPYWSQIVWTATEPSMTNLEIQIRASDDPGNMGSWITIANSGDEIPPSFDSLGYVQYRVLMTTSNNDVSPGLEDITLNWDLLGIGDDPLPTQFLLEPVTPNPANGSPFVEFGLPTTAVVGFMVFDVTGRLVQSILTTEYQPGWHTIQLDELRSGVYYIRMQTNDFEAAQRFVVIW